MATAYISEFTHIKRQDIPIASHETAPTNQTVTFTTSTASAAFQTGSRYIRIVADATCRYLVGSGPTAVAGSSYLPADTVEYIGIKGGDKIAFYDGSS